VDFDVILRSGTVLDGTGRPAAPGDVAVRDGRVAAVGDVGNATAGDVVDVTGLFVAPGFVDVHAHTDLSGLLGDEHLDVKAAELRQGVTTEVCGNCGYSPFPSLHPASGADPYLGLLPEHARRYFPSLAAYREAMADVPLGANLAPLLGHGRLRAEVVGHANRSASPEELRQMCRLTAEAMDEGAFGLSSGLMYAPGLFAPTEELVALAEVAARYGRPYTTHMRDEADRVEESVHEALHIGRQARVAVQISHHKIAGKRNWGRSGATLAAIHAARQNGVDVAIDVYPYTAGSTFLSALLPPWLLEGGPDAMLERLRDDAARRRAEADFVTGLPGWQNLVEAAGWHNVVLSGEPPLAGRSIAEIADDDRRPPVDVVADVLIDDPRALIVIHLMDEREVAVIGDAPFAVVGSDGIPVPGRQHPRLAGTFARVLARHRDDPDRLADAVRRMTSLPAARFGLTDRGVVAPGMVADLVVFDPTTITDNATYDDPLLPPSGVDHVLVAGRFALRHGRVTGERAGRVLEPG